MNLGYSSKGYTDRVVALEIDSDVNESSHDSSLYDNDPSLYAARNPPLPSYHVLCLKKACCDCACLAVLWQLVEQFRWKVTNCNCLLRSWRLPRNSYISVTQLLVLICFLIFQLVSFWIQLNDAEYTKAATTSDLLRIIAIICGRESVTMFAISWSLATRNTFWWFVIGIPFERALFYHIWVARYSILLVWVHLALFLVHWHDIDTIIENISISTNLSGVIAFLCVTFIFLFSFNYFRRNHWEFFLKTHWIFFLLFFYFAIKHHLYFWFDSYFMKIAIFCWIFDLLYRIYITLLRPCLCCNSKIKVADVELLTDDIIKLTLQQNNFYCAEGQYCFICIPAISITEFHPFSISNCFTNDKNETIVVFHIKVLGDWTEKLKLLALFNDAKEVSSAALVNWSDLKVFMEGPYGRTELPIEKYDSIILIGGGIGVTPMQQMFDHLVNYIQNNNITTIKRVHFLWSIRDPHFKTLEEFNRIHWQSVIQMNDKSGFQENITIKNTEIKTNYFVTKVQEDSKKMRLRQMYEGIEFKRPNMTDVIDTAKEYGPKCAIFACGPIPMINDVRKRSITQGIHCHTEKFHF